LAQLWEKRADHYRAIDPKLDICTSSEIFLKKAALEAEFSRIVCISFGSFDDDGKKVFKSFFGDNETDILNVANKVINNAMAKNWKLCGHNIKGFDIPCLGKRMLYNGINPSNNIQMIDKKPWEVPFIDTCELLSFGSWSQNRNITLDLLTCSLGIQSPKENMEGSQVNLVYWDDHAYREIADYCENDVNAVMCIMEKLCF
jgi:predicted PolB exonuclease-like 3'-5' exonuclease